LTAPERAGGAKPLPATSLIVCSRNRPALLAESIVSILGGDRLPAELIVVDQSNRPHPFLPLLPTPHGVDLRYLWSRSTGLGRANNIGIEAARHALLVFAHDDVLVTREWFGTLVQALSASGPRTVVTGQVRPTAAERPGGFQLALKTDSRPATYQGRIGRDVLYPLNMAMYRTAFDAVGRFDERLGPGTPFPGAEDSDLGHRLLEAGFQIRYVPEAVLYHRAWRPGTGYLPLRWKYGVARGGFYAKHFSWRDRYMGGRMVADIASHGAAFGAKLGRVPARACGDALLALGIIAGAARWTLTMRRQAAQTAQGELP
jgi:GT2 family glycosyltransferase